MHGYKIFRQKTNLVWFRHEAFHHAYVLQGVGTLPGGLVLRAGASFSAAPSCPCMTCHHINTHTQACRLETDFFFLPMIIFSTVSHGFPPLLAHRPKMAPQRLNEA